MPAYKNAKNNSWYVKFRYKNWKSEIKWVTKRGFKTKREALEWEQSFKQEKAGSLEMSFADFVKVYEEERKPRLKESTWVTKENIIETKLIPWFGDKKLCDITATDVVRWQNELLQYHDPKTGKPFSPAYLKEVHNQLSAVFNHAVRFYALPVNPARTAGSIGVKDGAEMKFWTKDQYLRFSEVMMDTPLAYYAFEVLYWCGIREGELLALTENDFDFSTKELSITKTFQHLNGRDIITDPKTPKSKRKVVMPDFLCEEMNDFFTMNYDRAPDARVFPVTKSFLYRKLRLGAEKAGVPVIRVHDIRHSHVSLLIDMGFGAVAIADRMGHESIDITYRYAHLFPTAQNKIAGELDRSREVN